MKLRNVLKLGALVGGLSALAMPSQATLMMEISDGITTLNYVDNGAGDVNPNANTMIVFTTIGNFTVDLAFTKSVLGGTDLSLSQSADITSTGNGGTLTFTVYDDAFSIAPATASHFFSSITPTIADNLDFLSTVDMTTVLDANGLMSSDVASASGTVSVSNPFTIKHVAVINASGPGNTSFDAITRVPEAPTVALLGLGLLGLVRGRRRA